MEDPPEVYEPPRKIPAYALPVTAIALSLGAYFSVMLVSKPDLTVREGGLKLELTLDDKALAERYGRDNLRDYLRAQALTIAGDLELCLDNPVCQQLTNQINAEAAKAKLKLIDQLVTSQRPQRRNMPF